MTAGLVALRLAHAVGAEARRVNVHLAPRRAKARDGVVLARGAQVGVLVAGLLALLPVLLALPVTFGARVKVGMPTSSSWMFASHLKHSHGG